MINRRLLAAAILALAGCVDDTAGPPATSAARDTALAAAAVQWVIPDPLRLTVGVDIDLVQTLPPGVRRGGVFAVFGGQLPVGVSLSPQGLLIATMAGEAAIGIVFSYTEP